MNTPGQRPLYALGLLLLASAVFHLVVWAVQGGPWYGQLAWRKPIVFGISAGVTTLSLGWLLGLFKRPWRLDPLLAWLFVLGMGGEVGLITMQTWRGVPSHFNHDPPLDHLIYRLITGLILLATLLIVVWTVRSFGSLHTEPGMALAVRSGLLLLVVSCVIGIVIDVVGERQQELGLKAEIYGAAGVLKFPHGMPMHALQWLPLLAWLSRGAGWSLKSRYGVIAWATAGQVVLTLYSLLQTFSGRGRGDLTSLTAALLAAGLASILLPFAAATATLLFRRLTASAGPTTPATS